MMDQLIIIILMIVIDQEENLVDEETPLIRSWVDPNQIVLTLQKHRINTNVINYQNGQIQMQIFLTDKPQVSYFLKIISQLSTIHLHCLLKFDAVPTLYPNSILYKEISILNQATHYKFGIEQAKRQILCSTTINNFLKESLGNKMGKFEEVNLEIIMGPILSINSGFSKLVSNYCTNWEEKQIKAFTEFKYFRKSFQIERASRVHATKISSLDLSQIQQNQNITSLFNITHDKRKIHKNYEKVKVNNQSKSEKRQATFFGKLKRALACFDSLHLQGKYDQEQQFQLAHQEKILRGIVFHSLVENSYQQSRGFFSSVKKYTGTFVDVKTTNQCTQTFLRSTIQKKVIMTEQLIKKQAKSNDYEFMGALAIQIRALEQLKQKSCRQIASYFLNMSLESPRRCLYSRYYPADIYQINKTKNKVIILADLCLGLLFLSDNKLLHRDLKPDNLRIQRKSKSNHVKMIDFGSCCPTYEAPQWQTEYNYSIPRTTRGYSIQFCEAFSQIQNLMKKQHYDQHPLYDIFAFGKIAQQYLLTNFYPQSRTYKEILSYLIGKCTEFNPGDRLNPNQLLIILYYLFSLQ